MAKTKDIESSDWDSGNCPSGPRENVARELTQLEYLGFSGVECWPNRVPPLICEYGSLTLVADPKGIEAHKQDSLDTYSLSLAIPTQDMARVLVETLAVELAENTSFEAWKRLGFIVL
jgi:hypothetical protein